jgi:hypothetical protein
MPKVVDAARVTSKDGAVWRECAGCGQLAALAPDVHHCEACNTEPVRNSAVDALLGMATLHARGPEAAAADFDRLARAYTRLACGPSYSTQQAAELFALAADLREAALRLREGRRTK